MIREALPSGLQQRSTTDCAKHVLMMHTGLGRLVAHTVSLQSWLPHAITVCGTADAFATSPLRNSTGLNRTITQGQLHHAIPTSECVRERDASACIRRHQAFALAPVRERRFRVYKEAPGFRSGPRERETLPRV
jgi:hypothetical protein